MTRDRFEEIKRNLHVPAPNDENSEWYGKLEPLASSAREAFKTRYIPHSNVSVDEMMMWFSGR